MKTKLLTMGILGAIGGLVAADGGGEGCAVGEGCVVGDVASIRISDLIHSSETRPLRVFACLKAKLTSGSFTSDELVEKEEEGRSVLLVLLKYARGFSVEQIIEIAGLMLQHGVDLTATDKYRNTVVHYVAARKNPELLKWVYEQLECIVRK